MRGRRLRPRFARPGWTTLAPAVVVLLAVVGPFVLGARAEHVDVSQALQGASGHHLLGTDDLGRDIFARVVVATRLSVILAVAATAIGVAVGVPVGFLALAPRVGGAVGATVNATLAFPSLMAAMFLAAVFGVGTLAATGAVGLAMAPAFARLTQTLGASIHDLDYVHAARMLGLARSRVTVRYVLPSLAEPLLANAAIAAGSALVVFSGLSFLGIGVQAPAYDWGLLLNSGLSRIYDEPAAAVGPGVAICLTGAAFSLAAGRQAAWSPRIRVPLVDSAAPDDPDGASSPDAPALVLEKVSISFSDGAGEREVVSNVSLRVDQGERVGLVGGSGSGKTVTALAAAGILPGLGRVSSGTVHVSGRRVAQTHGRAARVALSGLIGFVFQEPFRSLNPSMRIGSQLVEADRDGARAQQWSQAVARMARLKVAGAEKRARQFPHELSGGTLQRVMTAMALTGTPRLIIADEPTTALDVTVEAATLQVLDEALTSSGAALLLVSHDLAVVCELCPRIVVMHDGHIVEDIATADLLAGRATHPYTQSLLADVFRVSRGRGASAEVAAT